MKFFIDTANIKEIRDVLEASRHGSSHCHHSL